MAVVVGTQAPERMLGEERSRRGKSKGQQLGTQLGAFEEEQKVKIKKAPGDFWVLYEIKVYCLPFTLTVLLRALEVLPRANGVN